jgi:hypothetical protein
VKAAWKHSRARTSSKRIIHKIREVVNQFDRKYFIQNFQAKTLCESTRNKLNYPLAIKIKKGNDSVAGSAAGKDFKTSRTRGFLC